MLCFIGDVANKKKKEREVQVDFLTPDVEENVFFVKPTAGKSELWVKLVFCIG